MSNELTLQQAQQQVDEWIKTIGVRYFSELTNMAILTEEVGELPEGPTAPSLLAEKLDAIFRKLSGSHVRGVRGIPGEGLREEELLERGEVLPAREDGPET